MRTTLGGLLLVVLLCGCNSASLREIRGALVQQGLDSERATLSPDGGICLDLSETKIDNIEFARGFPIVSLSLRNTPVDSISPAQGMPLVSLDIQLTHVSDLGPVRGMPLEALYAGCSSVTNLPPLSGLPLKILYLQGSPVRDLSPLDGLNLHELHIPGTSVTCINVLAGMDLRVLDIRDTSVSDLSPLRGMRLHTLGFCPDQIVRGVDVVRKIRSLSNIRTGTMKESKALHLSDSDSERILPGPRLDPQFRARNLEDFWKMLPTRGVRKNQGSDGAIP